MHVIIFLHFYAVGIGVDDMFVVIQALEQLGPQYQNEPIHIKIAATMKHAGVSITVTSLTDILAFGIGATTVCNLNELNPPTLHHHRYPP